MRILKKARSLLYLHSCTYRRRRGKEKGRSTIYVLFKRLEKGREADSGLVFPLNPGKCVINDSMYVCSMLCGKSASFAT